MAAKPIVIVGAGGYAQEVAWIIDDLNAVVNEWNLLGFVDTQNTGQREHYGLPVLDGYESVKVESGDLFFICGMGTPAIRRKEALHAEALGWRATALIHPSVIRAKFGSVGEGSIVGAGAVMGPHVRVGRHCVLNMHVTLGHESVLCDYCVLSPGAHIAGRCLLEQEVFVGANASVYQGRHMGARSSLAANSFLSSDLAEGESALGVPAKVFHRQGGH